MFLALAVGCRPSASILEAGLGAGMPVGIPVCVFLTYWLILQGMVQRFFVSLLEDTY